MGFVTPSVEAEILVCFSVVFCFFEKGGFFSRSLFPIKKILVFLFRVGTAKKGFSSPFGLLFFGSLFSKIKISPGPHFFLGRGKASEGVLSTMGVEVLVSFRGFGGFRGWG